MQYTGTLRTDLRSSLRRWEGCKLAGVMSMQRNACTASQRTPAAPMMASRSGKPRCWPWGRRDEPRLGMSNPPIPIVYYMAWIQMLLTLPAQP